MQSTYKINNNIDIKKIKNTKNLNSTVFFSTTQSGICKTFQLIAVGSGATSTLRGVS